MLLTAAGWRPTFLPMGEATPDNRFGNFDFERWDPESVAAHPLGDSAFGVSQMVGNGWQWTQRHSDHSRDFSRKHLIRAILQTSSMVNTSS